VGPDATERKLTAILSADVAGYSRLMADDEVATVRTLKAYRDEIGLLARQHRGRVVDAEGDNLLAEFPSALDAVRCAAEIQRVLRARNSEVPRDRRMEFRIGVHLGDVMVEGDRIYGDGINVAARLESLAEVGGVCISDMIHRQVRTKLDLTYEDLGEQRVKNISEHVRVYRVHLPSGGEGRATRICAFGEFELDEDLYELRRSGAPVKLAPKVFDVLRYLVQHRERVVPKAELLEKLWPNEFVTESVLPTNITAARKALADERADPKMIQTVHGRGYRFIAQVQEVTPPGAPVEAARRRGDAPVAPVPPRGPAFIGREEVMAGLRARFEEALSARGCVVLLVGEPGIGKTRTAEEMALEASEREALVLDGRCYEGEGAPAFWPWVQILRSAIRQFDPRSLREEMGPGALEIAHLVPELRERFPDLPVQQPIESDEARFRLFESVSAFLVNASRIRPLFLILDDLHWADGPTLLLLQFLARELRDAPILLLGAYRDVEVRRQHPLTGVLGELAREPHFPRVLLRALPEVDVGRFIQSETDSSAPDELVHAVYQMTEGNPFFIHETVRLLSAEGGLEETQRETSWSLTLPQGIRDVIGRRLNTLSEECDRVLRLAAVIGRDFAVHVLERLTALPRGRLLELLEEAVAARIVTDDPGTGSRTPQPLPGRYAFSHALVRETLYEELTGPQRAVQHRRVGEILEEAHGADVEAHLSELAHHFFQAAAGGEVERAIDYSVRAAQRSDELLAYEESVVHYERALQALELSTDVDETQRAELQLALGRAELRVGSYETARGSFLRVAELGRRLGRPDLIARAAMGLGGWPPQAGRAPTVAGAQSRLFAEFRGLAEEALEAIGPGDSPLRAQLISALALTPPDQDSMEARERLSTQAVEMARRSGDLEAIAVALYGRLHALLGPDDTVKRLEGATEMLELARKTGAKEKMFTGHESRVRALLVLGDMRAADHEIDAMGELADELRLPTMQWSTARFRVLRALGDGRFDEVERLGPAAREAAAKARDLDAEAIVYRLWTTWLLRERGGLETVRDDLETFVRDFAWAGALPRAFASYLYSVLGDQETARRHFEVIAAAGFSHIPRDEDWLLCLALFSEACAELGDASRAEELYELLEPYAATNASHQTLRFYMGSVSHFLARLAAVMGRRAEATQCFEAALEMNERLGARPSLARTHYEFARFLLNRDPGTDPGAPVPPADERRARALLSEVETAALELSMQPLLEKARELG
jgi:class 3 adenylate cyclase/tetratricopeptide (TPR) repeat protein